MGVLDGRVVIVTGGGRGLGRAHCLELARQGASVVVNDLGVGVRGEATDQSPAQEVVGEITAMGGSALADATSVTDWPGMEALVERTVERFGDLHAVVNNAMLIRYDPIEAVDEAILDRMLAIGIKGAVWGVQALDPTGPMLRLVVKTVPQAQGPVARELRLRIVERLSREGLRPATA